jgi:hypothetical protein
MCSKLHWNAHPPPFTPPLPTQNQPTARPANAQEVAERAPSVIQCNEALREVTLYQNAGGKSLSRTFRYDKARSAPRPRRAALRPFGEGVGVEERWRCARRVLQSAKTCCWMLC